jgi:hypothetical protein
MGETKLSPCRPTKALKAPRGWGIQDFQTIGPWSW